MKRGKLAVLAVPLAGLLLLPLLACDTIYDPDVVQEYTEIRGTIRIPAELSPLEPQEAAEGITVQAGQPGNCPIDLMTGKVNDEVDEAYELPMVVADQPALVVKGEIPGMYAGGWCDPATIWFKWRVDKKCTLTIATDWENAEWDGFVPILYELKEGDDELTFVSWDLTAYPPISLNVAATPTSVYYLRWLKWYQTDEPTAYTLALSAVSGTVVTKVLVGAWADPQPWKIVPEDYPDDVEAGRPKFPIGGTSVNDLRLDPATCDEDGKCDMIGWFDGLMIPVMKCKSAADCVPPICTDLRIDSSDPMCAPTTCDNGYCTFHVFAFADNDSSNSLNFSGEDRSPPTLPDFIMANTVAVPGGNVNFKKGWRLYTLQELRIDTLVTDEDFDDVLVADGDGDGFPDDNCPDQYNPNQLDTDSDGVGDVCDVCPSNADTSQADSDGVEPGDACNQDDDTDGDEVENRAGDEDNPGDNCPDIPNGFGCTVYPERCDINKDGTTTDEELALGGQADLDNDGLGDACDDDIDADGIPNTSDFCPKAGDASNADSDSDGLGDACDNCRGNMTDCLTRATWPADTDDPRADWDDNWVACESVATMTAGECTALDEMCATRACSDCKPGAPDCYSYSGCTEAKVTQCDQEGQACILSCERFPKDRADLQKDCLEKCESKRDDCVSGGGCSRKKVDQCLACMDVCETLCASYADFCANYGALCTGGATCSAPNADQDDLDGDGVGDACDADIDGDGILNSDEVAGCDELPNSETDSDGDGIPDGCDNCTDQANFGNPQVDADSDGVGDLCDNCPNAANADQADLDEDGEGDACDLDDDNDNVNDDAPDNCPMDANEDQADADGDGLGDVCDICPDDSDQDQTDSDGDGAGDACDVCPTIADDQTDSDGDGLGNVCDPDDDGDGYCDEGVINSACTPGDNCPDAPNPDQADLDNNGIGDMCDADTDSDGIIDGLDVCPNTASAACNFFVPCAAGHGECNPTGHCSIHPDADNDGFGDACDPCPSQPAVGGEEPDTDGDMVGDNCGDNCPDVINPDQLDSDNDTYGDECDSDDDNDGFDDPVDNCPTDANLNQIDGDDDGVGDACDNCPADANPDQGNVDGDTQGDICDDDADNDGIFDNVTGSPCTGGAITNCDDNCPLVENPEQTDANSNGIGDDCEEEQYVSIGETEPNDTPDSQYIGTLALDLLYRISGDCAEVGNDGSTWTGDEDLYFFEVEATGTLDVTMDWEASGSDYDIILLQLVGTSLEVIDGYAGATTAKPEITTAGVDAGETYAIAVYGWSGTEGAYTVEARVSP